MGPMGSVAWERAMKIQEVILRAMAKRITWWQAAEIIGISERQMRRWHRRYEKLGYDGLWDRRRGGARPRRGAVVSAAPSPSAVRGGGCLVHRRAFFQDVEVAEWSRTHRARGARGLTE